MKFIKRILSIEFLVESILVVFAVANFSTISDYFIHSGMNAITSYSVGVLMGLILIASAMMLSRIERTAEIFNFVLYATLGAAILAAILQSLAYHTITHDWITSIIKGAGFPMVEVALAYSVSLYSTYNRRKEIENADSQFEERMAERQREATMNMDPEKLRAKMEEKMDLITDARLNKFTHDQLKKYVVEHEQNLSNFDHTEIEQLRVQLEHVRTENEQSKNERVHLNAQIDNAQTKNAQLEQMIINLSKQIEQLKSEQPSVETENEQKMSIKNVQANEQKMSKEEKMNMLIAHLIEHYDGAQTDELKPTKLAQELPIDRTTVSRYIEQLKTEQKLNGVVKSELLR